MNRNSLLLATLLVPASAVAGMYDQPYALIVMGQKSETRKEAPAAISRIDGESPRDPRKSDPIPPGKHRVDVSYASARAVIADTLKPLDIDLAPCTRYYLVAKYKANIGPEWEPAISYSEPIGECQKKFGAGAR